MSASESDFSEAKAQVGSGAPPKPLGRVTPWWTTFAQGRLYRPAMRVMHRLGWCYPQRSYISDTAVWCHWCGMRGSKPRMISESEMRIALASRSEVIEPEEGTRDGA